MLARTTTRLLLCVYITIVATQALLPHSAFGYTCPEDMTELDCAALQYGWTDWIPDNGDTCSSAGGDITTVSGSDNPSKVWNYFKSQGLDDMHVAAIMGNIQQESSYNPENAQVGPDTRDPSGFTTGGHAWGLAQWDPGNKILTTAKQYGITTPIYEIVTQLNIIWKQMNDVSPTGVTNMLDGFKKTSTIEDATQYYVKNFEGPSIVGPRLTFAQQALTKYGGTNGPAGATAVCGGTGNFSSAACTTAQGRQKILCEAIKYDPVSYSLSAEAGHQGGAAWHETCKTINASCYLDCSGLVNIAVYDAFRVDLRENTNSERTSGNWKKITVSELEPGDLIQPNANHVEIVDHVQGSKIFTFGAHTAKREQPGQVGPAAYTASSGYVYLRYVGEGV